MGLKKLFKNGKNGSDGYVVLETGKGGKGIVTNLPSDQERNPPPVSRVRKSLRLGKVSADQVEVEPESPDAIEIVHLTPDGQYQITVKAKDFNSAVNITFLNLADKSSYTIPREVFGKREFNTLYENYPGEYDFLEKLLPLEGKVKASILNGAWKPLLDFSRKQNEYQIEFSQIYKLVPELRLIDSAGVECISDFSNLYDEQSTLEWL